MRACLLIVRRNLLHIKRMPELLMDVTVQPVMFVLLFAFVFGASINVEGASYREFLVPGIMAQTMVFSAFIVAIGLVNDLAEGVRRPAEGAADRAVDDPGRPQHLQPDPLLDRHHRDGADGPGDRLADPQRLLRRGAGLRAVPAVGFAMIWVGIWAGSALDSVEGVQALMFTVMFPITFLANTFAPTENMPSWLRTIAEWNPISSLVQASRELWGNGPPAPADAALPLQYPVTSTLIWSVLITAVVAPLAIKTFQAKSRD